MNPGLLVAHFDRISDAADAIPRLRRFVLDLAVRGKLVVQDPNDEPSSALLKRIQIRKAEIAQNGVVRKEKPLPPLAETALPFCIPPTWRWSQLAEIGFINPRNTSEDSLLSSFVPMPRISAGYGVASTHEVRPWGEIKSGYTHFADGDVALAKITPCFENGKSSVFRGLTGGIGAGTTELHVVRPVIVAAEYILIFLKCPHFIESGIPRMTGTAGQKRVPTEYFAYSPFPLPPLAEQLRIVAKLEELMALCSQLETAKDDRERRLDRLTASSFYHLNTAANTKAFHQHADFCLGHLPTFTTRPDQIKHLREALSNLAIRGQLVRPDPRDEPVSELLKCIVAENGRLQKAKNIRAQKSVPPVESFETETVIPKTWSHAYLQDLAYQITDGTHLTPKYTEQGKPFLSAQNVKPFRFMPEKHRFVSEADFENYRSNRKPERGDVLLTRVGAGIGEATVLDSDFEFAFYVSLCLIKIPTRFLSPKYLVLWLNSPEGRASSTVRTYGKGASQGNLNLGLIRTFKIPVPPLAEQHRIVAKVDELMHLCDRLEEHLTKAQNETRSLLDAVLYHALNDSDSRRGIEKRTATQA
jgi:type I restriction enzyme S subunit